MENKEHDAINFDIINVSKTEHTSKKLYEEMRHKTSI